MRAIINPAGGRNPVYLRRKEKAPDNAGAKVPLGMRLRYQLPTPEKRRCGFVPWRFW